MTVRLAPGEHFDRLDGTPGLVELYERVDGVADRAEVAAQAEGDLADVAPALEEPLTAREMEVLRLLAGGASTSVSSDALGISTATLRAPSSQRAACGSVPLCPRARGSSTRSAPKVPTGWTR